MSPERRRIETLRDRVRESDDVDDQDAELLLEFSEELDLRSSEYSDHRHEKLLRHVALLAENVGGLESALEDRDAAEDLVRYINREYDNEETNSDYRTALRVFGKRLVEADTDRRDRLETDGQGYPSSIGWIPSGTSSTYDPAPDPSAMLRWEADVVPMIDHTQNRRDAALVALAFDAGPRGGELYDLEVGDVSEGQHGLQVTVDGKQGKRTVTLVPSVPYLQKWLAEGHPTPKDATAPLWSKLGEASRPSYTMVLKIFREAARRAGVEKPVTPTNFRKSSAAHLASKGMNQAHLEDHHGWVRGSKTASRYVSIFGEDAALETQRVWGVEDVPEPEDKNVAPVPCPACGRETPREKPLCVWCGQAMEPDAAMRADRVDDAMVRAIAEATGERAQALVETRRETRNDPEALADLIDRLEPLLEDD